MRKVILLLLLAEILILPVSGAIYTGTPTKTYDPLTKTITLKAAGNTLATIRVVDTISSLTYYEEILEITPGFNFEFLASRVTSKSVLQTGKYSVSPRGIYYLEKTTGTKYVPVYDTEYCKNNVPLFPGDMKDPCYPPVLRYDAVTYPINRWVPLSGTISLTSNEPYLVKFRYTKRAETGPVTVYVEPTIFNVALSEFSWWNTNYGYKHQFNITGGPIAVSPYQLKMRVYNTSGTSTTNTFYSTNFSVLNMSDFRVVDSTETTEWYYWIEQFYDNGMDVWIRAPTVAQQPANTTFYIYNGFAGAGSTTDGYTTFYPGSYDHFEGAAINGTQWNCGLTESLSGSIITLPGLSSTALYLNSTTEYPVNTSVFSKLKFDIVGSWSSYGFFDSASDGGMGYKNHILNPMYIRTSNHYLSYQKDSVSGSKEYTEAGTPQPDVYQTMEVKRNSTVAVTYTLNSTYSYVFSTAANIPTKNLFVIISPVWNTQTFWVDYTFVRNYVYPEPKIEDGYLEAEKPIPPTPTPTTAPTTYPIIPTELPGSGLYIGGAEQPIGILSGIFLTLDQQPFLLMAALILLAVLVLRRR